MGYLRKYARRRKERTEVITARVDADTYKQFKEYVEGLGLTISEAVALLIEKEVNEVSADVYTAVSIENTDVYETTTKSTTVDTPVYKPKPKRNTRVSQPRKSGGFSIKDYEVDGKVPCPLCREWYSYKNFSRHCKEIHGVNSTQEVIEGREEIVKELAEKRR